MSLGILSFFRSQSYSSLEIQVQQLTQIGCEKIYQEQESGSSTDYQSELKKLLDYAREGDVVYVIKVDRITRNTLDTLKIANELAKKEAGLGLFNLGNVDVNSDVDRVIYTTISTFAEKWKENGYYSAVMRVDQSLKLKVVTLPIS